MAMYRRLLPQLSGDFFITDGGIETTLIFHEGLELPDFAAFTLLKTPAGQGALQKYFRTYAQLARKFNAGLILEAATWRANPDWGLKLGYSAEALAQANVQSVQLLEAIRSEYASAASPIVISGCIGPRGDGYVPTSAMSASVAEAYHRVQIETFANCAADLVTAITMNYVEEAIGVARAAQRADIPAVSSFTLETDGKLPTGQPLAEAIKQVDTETNAYPVYYMINCAHPSHFETALVGSELLVSRLRGLRANASRMSHAQLNEAPELDAGNPEELGREYAALMQTLKHLNVMGGCCGTDHRHIEQIALACQGKFHHKA